MSWPQSHAARRDWLDQVYPRARAPSYPTLGTSEVLWFRRGTLRRCGPPRRLAPLVSGPLRHHVAAHQAEQLLMTYRL